MSSDYEPFNNAEEVWFWFCNCLSARGDGLRAKQDYSKIRRPLEVVDVQKIVKNMRILNQIDNRVLRAMIKWGELGIPPTHHHRAKASEVQLWEAGISWLYHHLRNKGVLQ